MPDNMQFIIILAVVVLGAVLVARFWRTILKWLLLIVGVIVLVGLVGLWLQNGVAIPQVDIQPPEDTGGVIETITDLVDLAGAVLPRPEPACPTPTYTAPAGPSFGEVLLLVLLVLALGGAGYFWVRWRIARRGGNILPRPRRGRRRRPSYEQQPVVYGKRPAEGSVIVVWEESPSRPFARDFPGETARKIHVVPEYEEYEDEQDVDLGFLGDLDLGMWGF